MIPSIDLMAFLAGGATDRKTIASQVDDICRSIGFLIVRQHGVPQAVCDNAWSVARQFFDLPLDQKISAQAADRTCPRGYFPLEQESLGKTLGVLAPPDRKESFSIGPLHPPAGRDENADFDFFYGANLWPHTPADLRQAFTDYYNAMEQLGAQLMQLLAAALQIESNFFTPFHTHHLSALRALNYPSNKDRALPGQRRAGAHSDYGTVTILRPDPVVSGLEVQLRSGEWIRAPIVEDAFIINLGDLMARWTNDRWVSTLHRVGDPDEDVNRPTARRQSMAYFMNPSDDAVIETISTCQTQDKPNVYQPVSAGEYLMEKFNSAI